MATVQIRVSSHRKYDIICGQTVYLCLTSAWANRTVNGTRRVLAIVRSGPHTGGSSCPTILNSCCGASTCCDTAKPLTWYTYCVEYNNNLLLTDISTGQPYLIDPCNDVLSIITDVCLVDSLYDGRLIFSDTYDPPEIANAESLNVSFTVNGAEMGDIVTVGFDAADLDGVQFWGYVTSLNTVRVVIQNLSGAAKNILEGTIHIDVWKRDF